MQKSGESKTQRDAFGYSTFSVYDEGGSQYDQPSSGVEDTNSASRYTPSMPKQSQTFPPPQVSGLQSQSADYPYMEDPTQLDQSDARYQSKANSQNYYPPPLPRPPPPPLPPPRPPLPPIRGQPFPGLHPNYQQDRAFVERSMYGSRPASIDDGRGRRPSEFMKKEEIDQIARIQWASTHQKDPYIEDYYYLAVMASSEVKYGQNAALES